MSSRRDFLKTSAFLGAAGLLAAPRRANATRAWENVTCGQLARDIAEGADGSTWVLGREDKPGGHSLYRYEGADLWQRDRASAGSAGVRIAVDPRGQPWVVNDSGEIWRRQNETTWQQLPGTATDIGIGGDGTVWVLGTDSKSGGYGLWRWTGRTWVPDEASVSSAGVRISVDERGQPWVVNDSGEIWRRNSRTSWSLLPGTATDIGIGARGGAWVLGTNLKADGYGLWQWNGTTWVEDSVSATSAGMQIAVGSAGAVWVVHRFGEIWLRDDFRP